MLWAKSSVLGVALSTIFATGAAAEMCARAPDLIALQVAALQQRLMVAALTCDEADLYNKFVVAYRSELISSDDALKSFFERLSRNGDSQYHSFKTKMANLYSARSIGNSAQFCAAVRASVFPALSDRKKDLAAFAMSQPSIVSEPYTQCGSSVAGASMTADRRSPIKTGNPDSPVKTRAFGADSYSERLYLPQRGDHADPRAGSAQARQRHDRDPATTRDLHDQRRDTTAVYCYPSTGSWRRCYRVNDGNPRTLYPYSHKRNRDRSGYGRAGWRLQPQRRNYR
jgi:hypothetical protein